MTNTYGIQQTLVLFAVAVICSSTPCEAQRLSPVGEVASSDRNATFTVQYPRPLESVAYTFKYKYGALITFEEAPLEHASDFIDPNKGKVNEGRAYLPRGGTLQFSFYLSEDLRGPNNLKNTIETAIEAYHNAGHPGQYSLQKEGEYLHIVPLARKNTVGVVEPVTSPLDSIITIKGDSAHPHLVLRDLTASITKSSGYNVYISHSPFLRGNERPVSRDFENVSARAVLRELLVRTGRNATWLMMFDVKSRSYYLSIQ